MATAVTNIIAQGNSIMSTVLGATYKKLRHVLDMSKNSGRDAYNGYGIHALGADPSPSGVIGYETLDQQFEFVVANSIVRGDSDDDYVTTLNTLFDKADQIFKQFVVLKMNLSGTVLKVDERTILDPERTGDLVALRCRVRVTYRQSLS